MRDYKKVRTQINAQDFAQKMRIKKPGNYLLPEESILFKHVMNRLKKVPNITNEQIHNALE